MVVLFCINFVVGVVVIGVYFVYLVVNVVIGKNIVIGRKLFKEEWIMEGFLFILLLGMGFFKGVGKSLMKLGFKGGEKFVVKIGL